MEKESYNRLPLGLDTTAGDSADVVEVQLMDCGSKKRQLAKQLEAEVVGELRAVELGSEVAAAYIAVRKEA